MTAAVPAPVLPLVAAVAPELMTWPPGIEGAGRNRRGQSGAGKLGCAQAGKTVLAIGPGIGQSPGDGQICDRAAGGDKDSGGDRCGCA